MTNYLPSAIQGPFNKAYDICNNYLDAAKSTYTVVENGVIDGLQQILPDSLKPLAERIGRALPEALFCGSMVTGLMQPVAMLFWAAKSVWVLTPLVKCVINGDLQQEAMTLASTQSGERLTQVYNKLVPAIAVSCAVGAAFCSVFGVLSFSPRLLMQGSFMASLSYLAYSTMVTVEPVVPASTPALASGSAATPTAK